MDIVIRNGVIQDEESQRVHTIKNEAGQLKKSFSDYIRNSPGPYYDFTNSHICIPRMYYEIKNFIGPQDPYLTKIVERKDFNKKAKYCSICHCLIIPNPAFSGRRKIFTDDDYFEKKKEDIDITKQMEKTTLNKETHISLNFPSKEESPVSFVETNFPNKKHYKIVHKYYQMVYKLLYSPILYPISIRETKLIWPWELTPYQKFRLENMNYKSCSFYSHQESRKISDNYIMIE